jgi:2-iminobutanoate/2-iminopropanoate deaminase
MKNIKAILEANGPSMEQVIKCPCIVANVEDFSAMSAAYVKFFPKKTTRTSFADAKLPLKYSCGN